MKKVLVFLTIFKCLVYAKVEKAGDSAVIASRDSSTRVPILLPNYTRKIQKSNKVFMPIYNASAFDWESDFKLCEVGTEPEPCPVITSSNSHNRSFSEIITPIVNNGTVNSTGENANATKVKHSNTNVPVNYMEKPNLCRCDDNCVKYGDCCADVLGRLKKIPEDSYYRCVRLLDSRTHFVRMISRCPSSYLKLDMNRKLCENPHCPSNNHSINQASLCPMLDVPVLNNKTGDLYRSIFCARCHSVPNKDIHPINRELYCSNFTDKNEYESFRKRAVYHQGQLRWTDPENTSLNCELYIRDFQPGIIERLIPEVRFCSDTGLEHCALNMTLEENRITNNLCFSYTQIVQFQKAEYFKNPHCAKCHHPGVDFKKDLKCLRKSRHRSELPAIPGTRMFSQHGPVGINILFHFSLDMDDGYVGYTSKCDGDEILDFIRHKCVPAICPEDYELVDGQCEKNSTDLDPTSSDNGIDKPCYLSKGSNSSSSTICNPCLILIFHTGEYIHLRNGSLLVKKSGGSGDVQIIQPGEYEQYNATTISVCAKHVDQTYQSSVGPPALRYISSISIALSVLCSLVHIVIYIVLPKMRNLPAKNLLCLTGCLLISQMIFLILIQSSNKPVCVVAAITMHYLFLASFFWMNIMSFDIWRTFSTEFLVRRYSGDSTKTFLKYSLFAWATPLVIVALAVVTDFYTPDSFLADPEFGPLARNLRPQYGHKGLCWIGQPLSLFVFFAFPVALIILCNLALFTLTASTIWIQNREGNKFINGSGSSGSGGSKEKNGKDSNGHPVGIGSGANKTTLQGCNSGSTKKSDRVRFKLYAKLALIMGLCWVLGFVSRFTKVEWFWYPFVILNGLQGTFIFVAFDCKSKVWKMIKDKWNKRHARQRDRSGTAGSSDLKRRETMTLSTTVRSSTTRTSTTVSDGGRRTLDRMVLQREKPITTILDTKTLTDCKNGEAKAV